MNYIVDTFKFIISCICSAAFAGLTILFFILNIWIPGVISLALMIVYIFAAFKNGQIVHIDSDRIYRLFPHDGAGLNWSSVREVGVVGLKVLGNPDKKHTGSKYIYFSDHAISEEDLFQMCLKWPPEDILYIRF